MVELKFLEGTENGYKNLAVIDQHTFYKTENNLYLGTVKLSNADDVDKISNYIQFEEILATDADNLSNSQNGMYKVVDFSDVIGDNSDTYGWGGLLHLTTPAGDNNSFKAQLYIDSTNAGGHAFIRSGIPAEDPKRGWRKILTEDDLEGIGSGSSLTGTTNDTSVILGVNASATQANSTTIGINSYTSAKGVSIGASANSSASSVAIGYNTFAYGIAIGENSRSENLNTVLGTRAQATNSLQSIAIGFRSKVTTEQSGTSSIMNAIALGDSAAVYASDSIALGQGVIVHNPNTIQLGGSNVSALQCAVQLTTSSDERDKIDIKPIEYGAVNFLKEIEPITYVSNQRMYYINNEDELSEEDKKNKRTYGICNYDRTAHSLGTKKGSRQRVGVSAQQTQEALKNVYGSSSYANLVNDNLFDYDKTTIPEGIESQLTVNYSGFIPFLIKAIQELSTRIEFLEKKEAISNE